MFLLTSLFLSSLEAHIFLFFISSLGQLIWYKMYISHVHSSITTADKTNSPFPSLHLTLIRELTTISLTLSLISLESVTHVFYSITLQEEQQLHSTSGSSGGLQSATRVPRKPGGLVLLRLAHTSAGMTPVKSLSLKNAIPGLSWSEETEVDRWDIHDTVQ